MTTPTPQQLDLERLLFRYSMALERGDFDTVTSILQIAAHNDDLNRMIQELDAEYALDSHLDPSLSGDPTMAQMTRPLTLPLLPKRKQGQTNRRSTLLFPVAAAIAVALVGLSILSFNPQPNDNEAGQFGLNLGSETATPTPVPANNTTGQLPILIPPTRAPRGLPPTFTPTPLGPTWVPTQGGLFITFTPTPAGTMLPPTVVEPSSIFTSTPMNPAELPTIVPPDLEPLPTVIPPDLSVLENLVPATCEGTTQDEAYTRVYALPFPDKTLDTPIGLYEPQTPVSIIGSQYDLARAEIWLYVNDQGWVNAFDVVLMPECAAAQEAIDAFARASNLLNRAQSLDPAIPTMIPTVPPPVEVTATSTPFVPTVPPTATPLR